MKVLDMDKILKISKEELINTSEKEYDMQINSLVNDILLKKKRFVVFLISIKTYVIYIHIQYRKL